MKSAPICNSLKEYEEGGMKTKSSKSRGKGFLSIAIYVLYFTATFAVPSEGKISRKSRRQGLDLVVRDLDTMEDEMPTSALGHVGDGRRRRPRHSSKYSEFTEFRKLLHRLRNARRGANVGSPSAAKRDNTEIISTADAISKKVKCGGCRLTKQWLPIKKSGCRTNYVLTPTCMGMCETWEIPDINPPFVRTHHRVCRPTQLEYRKIRLRECNPGVNPFHIVPVAKKCGCMKCKTVNTACRLL